MASSIQQIREALGVNASVPDSVIRQLMGTSAGKKDIAKIEAQPGATKPSGLIGELEHGAEQTAHDVASSPTGAAIEQFFTGPKALYGDQTDTTAPAKKKATKKSTEKLPSPESATESPFTQLAQQLAQTYLQQVNQLQNLTSGAEGQQLTGEAEGAAQTNLKGLTGGLPASVQGAMQQFVGNAPVDPMAGQVRASQEALGNAQAAGAIPFSQAIAATGPANVAGLEAAPYSQILNELASEAAYRASSPSYGASAFGATTANIPASLQYIFTQLGLPVPKPGQGSATGQSGLSAPGTAGKGGAGSTSSALSAGSSQTG